MKTWIIKFSGNRSSGRSTAGTGISNGSVEVRSTSLEGALSLFNLMFNKSVPSSGGSLWIQVDSITSQE